MNRTEEMEVKVVKTYITEKMVITVEEKLTVSSTENSWYSEVNATKLHLKVDDTKNVELELDELHSTLLRTILKQGEV
ncbi:hypothetical protein LCGC14_0495260 [marine sediment metagenome]|uniref:Uncharacterized protein n=1 Tax=marine sediment metagenome TaxID=412755 RepID=A0A0F9SAL9_9ZZZZ